MNEPSFKYFLHPHDFSTFSADPQLCDLCGEIKIGYKGPFYGINKIGFVCEECLIGGKLAEKEAFTNEGRLDILLQQIHDHQPELVDQEVNKQAKVKDEELRFRTPRVTTWQDYLWPVHCGDYCCFIKEAGKSDLSSIAPEGKIYLLFQSTDNDQFKQLWEVIRPDSPKDNSTAFPIGVYLFRCINCGEYQVLWDWD